MTVKFPADASGDISPSGKRRRVVGTFAGVISPQVQELKEGSSDDNSTRINKEEVVHFVKEVKQILGDEYCDFLQVMKDFKAGRYSFTIVPETVQLILLIDKDVLARLKELFKGYPYLITGLNSFLPKKYKIHYFPENELHYVSYPDAMNFIDKIKVRFEGEQKHMFKSFLKTLIAWFLGKKSSCEVISKVTVMFTDHHDMLEQIASFFPLSPIAVPARRATTPMTGQTEFEVDKNFVCHGDQELAIGNHNSIETLFLENEKDQPYVKGVSELDLSECEQCTPSYHLLPKNYPRPLVSQKTKLGAEVLNYDWLCKAPGNILHPFKNPSKNQYEQTLFICEDDRFMVDLKLLWFKAAITRVEFVLDKFNQGFIKSDIMTRLEDYFTALDLSCIKMLYGDQSGDLMDNLRQYPRNALPVILKRLEQKKEETIRLQAQGNKVWARVEAECNQYITRS